MTLAMLKPVPATVASEILTDAVPVFVRVNVCKLFEPMGTIPKLKAVVLGARTPGVALLEAGFVGDPALVNPTHPEIDNSVLNSVAIMANIANELCCLGSPVAAC
jgi:hypothetical protein